MDQLTSRLLLYGDLGGGSILEELAAVFSDWKKGACPKAALVRRTYDQVKRLLDLATDYGFDEDLWQSYLTFLLMTNENSFSLITERVGALEGSVNHFAKSDFAVFQALFRYDFTAIEEDLSGENGCVLRGFTMADSGVDSWYYLEVAGYGFGYLWRAAVDLNRDMGDPRIWEATIVINNDTDNAPVAAAKLRSEGSDQQPMPIFDGALIVDATDGLDDAERETLALREFFR